MKWVCHTRCLLSGYGVVNPGLVIDADEKGADEMLVSHFTKISEASAKEIQKEAEAKEDSDTLVKIEKLKELKVRIPRKWTKEKIDELFKANAEKAELPEIAR